MGVIEEVHEELDAEITLSDFREAVEAKVTEMGELADDETAAMLVAYELEDDRIVSIGDIDPELEEVKFLGKVRDVGDMRTFERDGEAESGHVLNVQVADETGGVRVSFWDEQAIAIDREGLELGTILRIRGRPRDGPLGLEVSVQQANIDEEAEIDIGVDERLSIEELMAGQEGVTIAGEVLATDTPRTFDRDDGSTGEVASLVLGDETGSVRVTLWDDQAHSVETISEGDVIEIARGSIRERDDAIECHLGAAGRIETIEDDISFVPSVTPIASLQEDQQTDIAGVIRSSDGLRTFERDDGSTGQVKNVRLQDETGDIRVAIWGEKAERELAPGDTVWFGDVQIQDGWQDDLEAAANWRSTIAAIDRSAVTNAIEQPGSTPEEASGDVGLDSFEDTTEEPPVEAGESVQFTGTVVQTGQPVLLDNGEETVRVDTDESVTLGEELTVQGERVDDRIDAAEIGRDDGKR